MTTISYHMHDQTECPGQLFPQDTHNIIKHRYAFAASLAKDKTVLEVGAGHGMAARLLSREAASYVAGEYSDENIDLLAGRQLSSPVVQFDVHQLPFAASSFELIITLAMIYYLDLEEFLSQVETILKKGGKLFFCTSNKDVPGFVPSPYTTRYYSIPELHQILERRGFSCEFYGAFPAGGVYAFRKIKAFVKTISKKLIFMLPGGKKHWQQLRVTQQGGGIPLPWHVEEIKADEAVLASLPCNQVNREYRIIYGVATLK